MAQQTTAQKITTAERRRQAVALRLSGATYESIGETIGVSTPAAFKLVKTALEKLAKDTETDAVPLRELELQRLDRLQFGLWAKAQKGDLNAVDRALKIMERRAKLLGIDAPEKHIITPDLTDEDHAILDRFKNG